jgi:hypothetical protein
VAVGRDALYTSPPPMAMDPPWSPRRYVGPFVDVEQARPSFVVQSSFAGAVLVAMAAREQATRMLPADLELAEPVDPGQETHPVIAVFGTHRRCTALVADRPVGSASDYHELILAVPYVRRRGSAWLHLCVVSAHSDAPITVWNGNVHYGFVKHAARLRWESELLTVTTADGRLACHGGVAADTGPAVPRRDGIRHLQAALSLPTIGHRPGAGLVSAYFDWQVDAAGVRAAQGYLALDQPVGSQTPCEWQAAGGGAFVVSDVRWRLSWPHAPRC